MYAILKEGKVIPVDDVLDWAKSFEGDARIIEHSHFKIVSILCRGGNDDETILVSTVFIGINHNFGDGRPLWFETMIFGGKHNDYQDRYETLEEAKIGHKVAVELVKKVGWFEKCIPCDAPSVSSPK